MRICSGHFKRGMTLNQIRTGKPIKVPTPVMFLAQERELAEDAFAGDIIGIPNHGQLRIGDTLTEGEKLHFTGIPSFAPELLKSVRALDPLKSKHLGNALQQIAEEGGASVFKPVIGSEWIVGVVGVLQFEVMADRIRTEFNIPVMFEPTQYYTARWIKASDNAKLNKFIDTNQANIAKDHDGETVFLARNAWHLNKAKEDFPDVELKTTREQVF
jgi:peptide chain release factor 3